MPSPMNVPSGCRFHPRCRYATQRCGEVEQQLGVLSNGLVACHYEVDFSSDKIVGEVVV